jgi:tetratricopeptide (TPR) repeat protein
MAGKRISEGVFLGMLLCAIAVAVSGLERHDIVMDAYNLRMQGKAGEAKAILEQHVLKNPNDAAAYYELARIEGHLGLGWTQRFTKKDHFDMAADIQALIDKAVELDPDNVIYAYYAGFIGTGQIYLSFMTGDQPGAKENLVRTVEAFESVLELKPDYYQAMLHIVNLCSSPEEFGGDRAKAEQYAKRLEEMDDVLGAKARSLLLTEEADKVDYWQKVLEEHEGNADVLEELGKACLREYKVDDAVSYFEKAIEIDPKKLSLFLDLSVYHSLRLLRARDDKELRQVSIASGDAALKSYIESEPILPMLAYAIGARARLKGFSDDKEQSQALYRQAEALDSYFSRATGSPHPILFIPPDEIYDGRPYYTGEPF